MLASEKLAIAAHLHVLMRRKVGRVTDTEWLASNAEYAAAMVRLARQAAAEGGHADLAEWADKLAQCWEPAPAKPVSALPGLGRAWVGGAVRNEPVSPDPEAPRYIGGLR
ncbi:hypothetical protein PSQ40_17615 [Curvibacter sp. HBC61]|uniref:Uncharacterized protein n=1 Tax=Curvibacter cyanobacteriorum TaxID=3026422 RepID=A0ABT5N2U8_9BURK|nr:hypothetical protein [Curvibacter sp. HBC61]MDD0840407.1 hypothetical protein [Curvibacter sp. HBC61]